VVCILPPLRRPCIIQAGRVGAGLAAASAISSHLTVKRLVTVVDLVEQQASRSFSWSLTSALITETSSGALL
jgi:hypothetical protein